MSGGSERNPSDHSLEPFIYLPRVEPFIGDNVDPKWFRRSVLNAIHDLFTHSSARYSKGLAMRLILLHLITLFSATAPAAAQSLTLGVQVAGRVEGGCRVVARLAQPIRPSCSVPFVETHVVRLAGGTKVVILTPDV